MKLSRSLSSSNVRKKETPPPPPKDSKSTGHLSSKNTSQQPVPTRTSSLPEFGASSSNFQNQPTHIFSPTSQASPYQNTTIAQLDELLPMAPTSSPVQTSLSALLDEIPMLPQSLTSSNVSTNSSEAAAGLNATKQSDRPEPALDAAAINSLRQHKANDQNLGMRFGSPNDTIGFKGDAYSLVPHEFGNNPKFFDMCPSPKMNDSEFSQSVGTAIDNGINMEVHKVNSRDVSLSDAMNTLSDKFNLIIADMGNPPVEERYAGRGDTKTTPKFGRREVDADSVKQSIRIAPDISNSKTHSIAANQSELHQKMESAGLQLDKPLGGQEGAFQEFLTKEISAKLNATLR